jgi:hypothetical protein
MKNDIEDSFANLFIMADWYEVLEKGVGLFKRTVSVLMLSLLVVSALALAVNVQPVTGIGSAHVRADGSIDSRAAPTRRNTVGAFSVPPQTEWNKTYGGTGGDYAYALVQTADGGYALAGSTTSFGAGGGDAWLVKTDASGNMQWNKTYGGPNNDWAYALVQTSDGGYALAGWTASFGAGFYDCWLVKTDASGNMQWNKTYGGTLQDGAYALVQTADGGYALAGETQFFVPNQLDFWLIKTDANGNALWNKTYGGTGGDYAYALVQTADGGYALAGGTNSYGAGNGDAWLVKTDSSGNMQWNKAYGGTGWDEAYALVQTGDSGYALAGYTTSFAIGYFDFWLVKTDANGNALWNKTYGTMGSDKAQALVQTTDGGYALAGWEGFSNESFGAGVFDFWLVKTDSSGNMQWNKAYGGTGWDEAYALVQTGDSGYALAGYTNSSGADLYDFWLVKLGPEVGFHDIASTNVASSKTVVGQGFSATISVTVANQGGYTETFNTTAYANTTIIASQNVTLPAGNSLTVMFTWNTTGLAYGNYTLSAYAWPVPGETDTADNNYTYGLVLVTIMGDVDGNGTVNVLDAIDLSNSFGKSTGQAGFNANADFDDNGIVNILDAITLANHYNQHYP